MVGNIKFGVDSLFDDIKIRFYFEIYDLAECQQIKI